MLTKGWKVVKAHNHSSAVQNFHTGLVFYRKGTWTKPRYDCGPLTIFKTIEAAKFFVSALSRPEQSKELDLTILHCVYEPSNLESVWCNGFTFKTPIEELERLNNCIIKGCVALADAIMPLE